MKILAAIAAVFICLVNAQPVLAHTLRVDNGVGVTVHVTPDDEPVSGSSTKITISIERKEVPNFAQSCDCRVEIVSSEEVLREYRLTFDNGTASVYYTFLKAGPYSVRVSGGNGQDQFSTEFSYQVRGGNATETAGTNAFRKWLPFIVAGVIATIVFLFLWPSTGSKSR